jgi:hypothetical protein
LFELFVDEEIYKEYASRELADPQTAK